MQISGVYDSRVPLYKMMVERYVLEDQMNMCPVRFNHIGV